MGDVDERQTQFFADTNQEGQDTPA